MAIVGGLLWLANMTRVDIAYSASQLARFMTNPGPSHFKAAIRVLIYVRDTADRALVMQPNPDRNLESYVRGCTASARRGAQSGRTYQARVWGSAAQS